MLIPRRDKWADQKQVTGIRKFSNIFEIRLVRLLTESQWSSDKREVAEL